VRGTTLVTTARRVCVVTGTRAEYGLLYWLLREIDADPELELQLIVTGAHLAPEFGATYRAIEEDGFDITARVDSLLASNTDVGVCKSLGLGIIGFADAYATLRPDVLVVLGDRFEILAAVQSAMLCNIPIAHIHGGEVTEGAVDEGIRHAITKMAHLHFVAAEPYARRVIRMGEDPTRVWVVGAPALDNIDRLTLLDADALREDVGLMGSGPLFLVTYHPVTRATDGPDRALAHLMGALDEFPLARVLITKANADAEGSRINAAWEGYVQRSEGRAVLVASLGQVRYLSAVKAAVVVIGNSSSGLIEAPALGTPTVNVGDRQRGRLKAPSVLDAPETHEGITAAIARAMSSEFLETVTRQASLYGKPGASRKIVQILKETDLDGILMKTFYDGPVP
jgi:GDP/UDP-N,N'-diacetylbacillosamine 2-epimerase (hydrolysing)